MAGPPQAPTHVLEPDTPRLRESLHPDPETPSPTPAGPRIVAAIVALLLAFASFALATSLFHRMGSQPVAAVGTGKIAFTAYTGETWQLFAVEPDGTGLVQLTDLAPPLVVSGPAWSPDGSRLAYVVRESATDRSDIWVMNADGSEAHAITDGRGSHWGPTWSPDGSRIAFAHGYDIYVMDADGTSVTNLMPDRIGPGAFDPSWSPDGESIAFVGRETDDDLYVMLSDGSAVRTLFSAPGAQREPAWSPDGSTIAFADHTQATSSEFGEFTLVDAMGAVVGKLSNLPQVAQAPAWSPDGRQIAFMANVEEADREAIYVMNADGTDVHEIPGLPANAAWPAWQPVPAEETTPSPSPATPPADGSISAVDGFLPEGRLLVQVDDQVELLEQGAARSRLIGQDLFALDLFPDGSRALVSTPWDSVGPETALVSLDLTSGERTPIADLGTWGIPARWSPDGSSVAVRVGERNLLCVHHLAIEEPRCLPELGRVYAFDWSPDGTRIVFEQGLPGSLTILDVASGQTSVMVRWDDPEVLDAVAAAGLGAASDVQFQGPRWSRSGRYVAALGMMRTDEGHANMVLVFDLDGSVVARGVPFHEFSEARGWSPTADVFGYASGEPPYRIVEARLLDVSTDEDRLLFPAPDSARQTIHSLVWSPSGRWIAVVLGDVSAGWFVSEIQILDTTGADPPRIFETSEAFPELVEWGP
jgi:TolB protein